MRWTLAAIFLMLVAQAALAQTPAPMLEQLSGETRRLYQDVRGGVARVQLPPPRWLNELAARDNPARKWDRQLDPQVRQKLEEEQRNAAAGQGRRIEAVITAPATQGAGAGAGGFRVTRNDGNTLVLDSQDPSGGGQMLMLTPSASPANAAFGAPIQIDLRPAPNFTPNNIGLLLDEQGHVLVPLYIEKETLGNTPVRLSIGEGQPATARFVGSDRQTNLTVLKLDRPAGKPVRFSARRPADGSMVLVLSPATGTAYLSLWTGGKNDYGIAVAPDGNVYGLVRYGQFLSGGACQPVVQQLIATGGVQRAALGVAVAEVRRDDPNRGQQFPALGDRPAIHVRQVMADSAAAKGGLLENDLILSVAGEPVADVPSFAAVISARRGPTELRILRGQGELTVTVDLQPR